jgi:3-deoxy-D-manno-octulosonic acid kinase
MSLHNAAIVMNTAKMSNTRTSKIKVSKNLCSYILYDADIIAEPALPEQVLQLFNRDYHTNQQARQNNSTMTAVKTGAEKAAGIGRARVTYFSYGNRSLVLKHYYRGGAVAAISKDRYLGFNIENSRAFREWRLLDKMQQLGLPVPRAVAAHVEKALFSYTADLVTEEIKQARTLADVLSKSKVNAEQWKKIGACIRLFHQHNVYHADLNARNILLTESGDVYLIDFDRGQFRADSASWKMANLARLKRSLLKFKNNTAGFNFVENDWNNLLSGYKS